MSAFRQLDYQDRVLAALDAYLAELKRQKQVADVVATATANLGSERVVLDFAAQTWDMLRKQGRLPPFHGADLYNRRVDGCGRPVPNVVLKVPTGGGKTWLAVSGVSKVLGQYLNRNTGFVLWIVPNEAIYAQTLKHFNDREHAYRQALDRAAAGRVRILEKGDHLDARDVDENLCVMLLMLQSSNRQDKETLKVFQDRGDVHGFFPAEGDQQAHAEALARTPNLDAYTGLFPLIKDSLGNALRTIRPVVVLDEGHKAISRLAQDTLYGFNPCFVLELTATPTNHMNVLVEVTGRELDREGMIKMPLNLDPRQGLDWKATLNAAVERLRALAAEAQTFRADTNRYIRPILLVQVERTGKDQRGAGFIHAEDVKDWLLMSGFDAPEIAIKTSEQNDLSNPENQDLLAETNRVRVIITKQALQEGWDCPFAYILCSLAAVSNLKDMTQLTGRILRQPWAEKTGVPPLDECYVITHHAETRKVVDAVKKGLEQDGLGDVVLNVAQTDAAPGLPVVRTIERREPFRNTKIILPRVLHIEPGDVRDLDYETDVLAAIDWRGYDAALLAERIPDNVQPAERQMQRLVLKDDGGEPIVPEAVTNTAAATVFDASYASRMISDLVPNAFVARELVGRFLDALRARSLTDDWLGERGTFLIEELRRGLLEARDAMAEALFRQDVVEGRTQFRLRLDGQNWHMPDTIETTELPTARPLTNRTGGALERSLFVPVYYNELNDSEREVAWYLDGEQALAWWHRNAAKSQYALQGWKKNKVYPDFIFAVQRSGGSQRLVLLETKGDQLAHNLDSTYKAELLEYLSTHFQWDDTVPDGQLELPEQSGDTVEGALILMSEWQTKLPDYFE